MENYSSSYENIHWIDAHTYNILDKNNKDHMVKGWVEVFRILLNN